MRRHILWLALAVALTLASCGGGSSSPVADAPVPETSVPEAPVADASAPEEPAPPSLTAVDRIEPLDTAMQTLAMRQAKAVPAAVSRMLAGAPVPRVALGLLVSVKAAAAQRSGALKIGQGRAVDATADAGDLARKLRWSTLADGSQVAALAFSSDDARAIRLGVLARQLPAGAILRFYGADGADVVEMSAAQIDALRQTNEAGGLTGDAARMVWGPDTAGAVSTLEVQLPAGAAASQLQLAVPQLSHLMRTVDEATTPRNTADIGTSSSCNLDVMCDAGLSAESRAVAKLIFIDAGDAWLCSGTLMNDIHDSRTPYFLTAAHCISNQAAASSAVTYWFFRAASCNSSPVYDRMMTRVAGGARLLYADTLKDNTLLLLNNPPPAQVVYAGSDYSARFAVAPVPNVPVVGVHHPRGDLQKYSVGLILGYGICGFLDDYCYIESVESGTMLMVSWVWGGTEPGSSGSPLFATLGTTRYVVGALSHGNGSCQNGVSFYGRFDQSLYGGLKDWLMR
jgi:hypothetical protein